VLLECEFVVRLTQIYTSQAMREVRARWPNDSPGEH
jgi:hypothetical protein